MTPLAFTDPSSAPPEGLQAYAEVIQQCWPVFAIALIVSLVMTPLCRAFALRRGIVDKPDAWLKPHERPIPYLGGVAIFAGWVAGVIFVLLTFTAYQPDGTETGSHPAVDLTVMLGIMLAGTAIMILGLADDLRVMSPRIKLAGNIAVAGLLLGFGLGDDIILIATRWVGAEFEPGENWLRLMYSIPITVFLVVGACNATNLIDGLDGLCGGVLGIISLGFLALALHLQAYELQNNQTWSPQNVAVVVLAMAMMGAALGFLPFNRNPAKIFMGDAGSMLLGLNSAVILLLFAQDQRFIWMLAATVIFGLPVADMLLTLARRWRSQRPLMEGDRSHFYDQLIDRGVGVKGVVRVSYALTAGFVILGLLPTFMRLRHFLLIYAAAAGGLAYLIHKYKMVRVDLPKTAEHSTPSRPD